METFLKKSWEGNVREMENTILQGILYSTTDEILPKDIGLKKILPTKSNFIEPPIKDLLYKEAKAKVLQQFNSSYIGNLLSMSKGNVTGAARLCGLERQALQQIMRRYDIKAHEFRK